MHRDPTTIDRSDDQSLNSRLQIIALQQSHDMGKSGVASENELSMPSAQTNPEFAKWWKRWVSRAQRISVKRNPWARKKIEPPRSNPQAATAISADCEFKRYL